MQAAYAPKTKSCGSASRACVDSGARRGPCTASGSSGSAAKPAPRTEQVPFSVCISCRLCGSAACSNLQTCLLHTWHRCRSVSATVAPCASPVSPLRSALQVLATHVVNWISSHASAGQCTWAGAGGGAAGCGRLRADCHAGRGMLCVGCWAHTGRPMSWSASCLCRSGLHALHA